jgi:hypothetical protein
LMTTLVSPLPAWQLMPEPFPGPVLPLFFIQISTGQQCPSSFFISHY